MSATHSGVTGHAVDPDDPINELPPFVTIKRASEALWLSRATIWRRVKDGTLKKVGSGKITKASIRRFAQPIEVT
jgi:hypothetical protein